MASYRGSGNGASQVESNTLPPAYGRLSKAPTRTSFLASPNASTSRIDLSSPTSSRPSPSSSKSDLFPQPALKQNQSFRSSRQLLREHIFEADQSATTEEEDTLEEEDASKSRLVDTARGVRERITRTGTMISKRASVRMALGPLRSSTGSRSSHGQTSSDESNQETNRVIDEIKVKAFHDSLMANHHSFSPVDGDISLPTMHAPVRRRSLFTPGLATRGEDPFQRPPLPVHAESAVDLGHEREHYFNPALSESSPLAWLATLDAATQDRLSPVPRSSTPADKDYGHLGAGMALRVTNGMASPIPSVRSMATSNRRVSPESTFNDSYFTAPEGFQNDEGQALPAPNILVLRNVSKESGKPTIAIGQTGQPSQPRKSITDRARPVPRRKTKLSDFQGLESSDSEHDSLDLSRIRTSASLPPSQRMNHTSKIAQLYIDDLPSSPFATAADLDKPLPVLPPSATREDEEELATSKANEFDDELFEDSDTKSIKSYLSLREWRDFLQDDSEIPAVASNFGEETLSIMERVVASQTTTQTTVIRQSTSTSGEILTEVRISEPLISQATSNPEGEFLDFKVCEEVHSKADSGYCSSASLKSLQQHDEMAHIPVQKTPTTEKALSTIEQTFSATEQAISTVEQSISKDEQAISKGDEQISSKDEQTSSKDAQISPKDEQTSLTVEETSSITEQTIYQPLLKGESLCLSPENLRPLPYRTVRSTTVSSTTTTSNTKSTAFVSTPYRVVTAYSPNSAYTKAHSPPHPSGDFPPERMTSSDVPSRAKHSGSLVPASSLAAQGDLLSPISSSVLPKRLQKKPRPKSLPPPSNRIFVQSVREVSGHHIPPVPVDVFTRYAERCREFPPLDRTVPSLGCRRKSEDGQESVSVSAPLRFPSPARPLESEPQWRLFSGRKLGFSATRIDARFNSGNQKSGNTITTVTTKAERRASRQKAYEQAEIYADIADFGDVTQALGCSPYDAAKSTSREPSPRKQSSSLQADQRTNAGRCRKTIGMDASEASELARMRSQYRNMNPEDELSPRPEDQPFNFSRPTNQSIMSPMLHTFTQHEVLPGKRARHLSMAHATRPIQTLQADAQAKELENRGRRQSLEPAESSAKLRASMKEPLRADWQSHTRAWAERRKSAGAGLRSQDQAIPHENQAGHSYTACARPGPYSNVSCPPRSSSDALIPLALPPRDPNRVPVALHRIHTGPFDHYGGDSVHDSSDSAPKEPTRRPPPPPRPSSSSVALKTIAAPVQQGTVARLSGRFEGGLAFGFERGAGVGGSAGTREMRTGASRKSVTVSRAYGLDLSDLPVYVSSGR